MDMSQTKETVLSDYIDFIANRILISIKEEEYMFKACIKDDQKKHLPYITGRLDAFEDVRDAMKRYLENEAEELKRLEMTLK